MGDLPLRTPRHRRLGRPLPYQLANVTRAYPHPTDLYFINNAINKDYAVLVGVSTGYPTDEGKLLTRYAPLRRSPSIGIATNHAAPRLACVKPAASVHPEPGSNSSLYISIYLLACPDNCNFHSELTLLD